MNGPRFYIGCVLLGIITSIVGHALDLDTFDYWALVVIVGLFWYVTAYEPTR